MDPSSRPVDQIWRVRLAHAVRLSLSFVENVPHDDARTVPVVGHHRAQFVDELSAFTGCGLVPV